MLEGELDRLVPLCAKGAVAAVSASHRALAVATLDAVAAYPYHLLHRFRPQVNLPADHAWVAKSCCRRNS